MEFAKPEACDDFLGYKSSTVVNYVPGGGQGPNPNYSGGGQPLRFLIRAYIKRCQHSAHSGDHGQEAGGAHHCPGEEERADQGRLEEEGCAEEA